MPFSSRLFLCLALFALSSVSPAEQPVPGALPRAPAGAAPAVVVTDPSYHLRAGDTVAITVFNQPDLAATQTIGRGGEVRLQLIAEIVLAGQTVRESENTLEKAYRDRQFLRNPVVTVTVVAYLPREISVLGSVRQPGTVVFPRDTTALDIVDVITLVGGFLPVSKSDAVTVTRRLPDGKETVTTLDLDDVISGRRHPGRERADFPIYPGDRIWVPERLF
jgi:polysaccharide export outer membrane protein